MYILKLLINGLGVVWYTDTNTVVHLLCKHHVAMILFGYLKINKKIQAIKCICDLEDCKSLYYRCSTVYIFNKNIKYFSIILFMQFILTYFNVSQFLNEHHFTCIYRLTSYHICRLT